MSSTIFFYCSIFKNASWSALIAKLWRLAVAILFVNIGSRNF